MEAAGRGRHWTAIGLLARLGESRWTMFAGSQWVIGRPGGAGRHLRCVSMTTRLTPEMSGESRASPRATAPPVLAPKPQAGSKREIATGSLWTAASFGASTLAGPVLAVAIVRGMSRPQYGAFSTASALIGLLAILAALGLGGAVAQLGAAARVKHGDAGARAVLSVAVRIAVRAGAVMFAGCGALVAIAARVSTLRPAVPAIAVMVPMVALAPLIDVVRGFLTAHGGGRRIATATVASAMLTTGLTVPLLILSEPSASVIAAIRSVGIVTTAAVLAGSTAKLGRRLDSSTLARSGSSQLLRVGMVMLLAGTFALAVDELDVFVLGATRGTHATALYAPASALAAAVMSLPTVIATFYLPVVSREAARRDRAQVRHLYHWATRWNLVLASPALGVVLICPNSIMRIVFGPDYGSVGLPLRILGVAILGQLAFGFNALTLTACGLRRVLLKIAGLCVCLSIVACCTLIPPFGMDGAAIATTVTLGSANILCSGALAKGAGIWPWDRTLAFMFMIFGALVIVSLAIGSVLGGILLPCVVSTLFATVTSVAAFAWADPAEREAIARQAKMVTARLTHCARPQVELGETEAH